MGPRARPLRLLQLFGGMVAGMEVTKLRRAFRPVPHSDRRGRPRRLHLGCGACYIPGFFHIDLTPHDHIDHVGRVERLDFIKSDSVELIYASHVLEHFGRYEVFDVLSEWYRVLAPGGLLRVGVPKFRAAAEYYLAHGDIRDVLGLVMGGQTAPADYHFSLYDETNLGDLLADVGFIAIEHYDWRATEHAGVDDFTQAYLPHLDKNNGVLVSLNVEATK
jgi:predicted SAM-dependent methyltransferase